MARVKLLTWVSGELKNSLSSVSSLLSIFSFPYIKQKYSFLSECPKHLNCKLCILSHGIYILST